MSGTSFTATGAVPAARSAQRRPSQGSWSRLDALDVEQVERVDGAAGESAGGRHDARDWQERSENQNANELAAQALARHTIGRRLRRDEIAMPLFGLSNSTVRRPIEMRLQSFIAHLVYGTATELTRRSMRAQFEGATADATR